MINIAVKYLVGKYPEQCAKYFPSELNTDDHDDKALFLLVGQYYYGIAAKKELKEKLIELNLVEPK